MLKFYFGRVLMVVIIGRWSDVSNCFVVMNYRMNSVLVAVVISGEKFVVVLCSTLLLVCLC